MEYTTILRIKKVSNHKRKELKDVENQENENNKQQYNNGTGLNKTLYTGMNGKKVTIWKFILGIILLVGGTILAISAVL